MIERVLSVTSAVRLLFLESAALACQKVYKSAAMRLVVRTLGAGMGDSGDNRSGDLFHGCTVYGTRCIC